MNVSLALTIAFCSISRINARVDYVYGTACADSDGTILGHVSTSFGDTGLGVPNKVGIELIDLCEEKYRKEKICQIGKELVYEDGSHSFIPYTIANVIKKGRNDIDVEKFDLNSRAAFERLRKIKESGESEKSTKSKTDDGAAIP